MLKVMKPGGEPTVIHSTSHKGHRKEVSVYFHPFATAEKTVPENQSVHSDQRAAFAACPAGEEIHALVLASGNPCPTLLGSPRPRTLGSRAAPHPRGPGVP